MTDSTELFSWYVAEKHVGLDQERQANQLRKSMHYHYSAFPAQLSAWSLAGLMP